MNAGWTISMAVSSSLRGEALKGRTRKRSVYSYSSCKGFLKGFCSQRASDFLSSRFRSWKGQRSRGFWISGKMNRLSGLSIGFA